MKTRVDSSFGRGQDNEKTFDLRMKNPKDLKKLAQLGWDKNKIEYQYNSVGFRSIEFEEPHDAIACFGCSHTEGEGVRAEYRWSNIVAKTIGLKCYNLGIGATGINSHYDQVNEWVPKLKPKAVFVFASYPFRYDFYYNNNRITLNKTIHGAKGRREHEHFKQIWKTLLNDDRNFNSNYEKSIAAIKYICLQLNVPCVIIKCNDYFKNDLIDHRARDLEHPGESQHGRIAEAMLKEFYNA